MLHKYVLNKRRLLRFFYSFNTEYVICLNYGKSSHMMFLKWFMYYYSCLSLFSVQENLIPTLIWLVRILFPHSVFSGSKPVNIFLSWLALSSTFLLQLSYIFMQRLVFPANNCTLSYPVFRYFISLAILALLIIWDLIY